MAGKVLELKDVLGWYVDLGEVACSEEVSEYVCISLVCFFVPRDVVDFSGVSEFYCVAEVGEDFVDASPGSTCFYGDFGVRVGEVVEEGGDAVFVCGESVLSDDCSFFI